MTDRTWYAVALTQGTEPDVRVVRVVSSTYATVRGATAALKKLARQWSGLLLAMSADLSVVPVSDEDLSGSPAGQTTPREPVTE